MTDAGKLNQGGCSCGYVRYQTKGEPMIVHACHCTFCQRQTGSSNVVNALFEADRIELTAGTLEYSTMTTLSGKGQVIARCLQCKTALWSSYDFLGLREKVRFLRVGTLDDPSQLPPNVHIFASTKLPWYEIPASQAVHHGFYDIKEVWSDISLARMENLAGRKFDRKSHF